MRCPLRDAPTLQRWTFLTLLCLSSLGFAARLSAADEPLRKQAQEYEREGRWLEACSLYDEMYSRDRTQPEFRDAYRRCLRNYRQVCRHQDSSLWLVIEKLSPSEAMNLIDQVLFVIQTRYVERDRVDLTALMHQGIRELRTALDSKPFVQARLPRLRPGELDAFRARLDASLQRKIQTRGEVRDLVRDLTLAGIAISLKPGVLAMEIACGLCNSLDEYSFYLAPGRFNHVQSALKGKFVGIGVELTIIDQKVEIARVYRKSPAAEARLGKGDRVTRINGELIEPLSPETATERLMGEAGTVVELEIISRGQTVAQTVRVERQAVLANSVEYEVLGNEANYIGYLRIHNFQESTVQEVKDALQQWRDMPLRGLIIDLRGNLGGLFKSALQVSEMFMGEGVIAHTTSPVRDLNRTFKSHNVTPLLPLSRDRVILLVDGETASSAEVLAGALKENQRAILIGQTTYGKGSIQSVVPLERLPGGLRLSVAKFTSPSRQPYSERGITPDYLLDTNADPVKEAIQLLFPMTMMR